MEAPDSLTADQKRNFIGDNQPVIDKGLGMSILRLVHASCADAPGVILLPPGREEPVINLGEIEDGMIDRIYSMVLAQKKRLSGERYELP